MSTEYARKRQRENERKRKRYAEDAEHRKRKLEAVRRYHAAHKPKIIARRRRRYATDPEYRAKYLASNAKSRRANLLKRYGISWPEYELRLALQNHACAICRKKPERRLLCVDHCHKTGKVRGLLCSQCNAALGSFEDDPNITQAAADYLLAFYESLKAGGDVVTRTDEQTESGKAGRLLHKAILLELQCERGQADDGATDKVRLIARKLVDMATEGDIQAIKEVLDRIDGRGRPVGARSLFRPHPEEARRRQVCLRRAVSKSQPPRRRGRRAASRFETQRSQACADCVNLSALQRP